MKFDTNQLFLAPMAGVSDIGMREVCSICGADATFTEMISAQAMKYDSKRTFDMLSVSPFEKIKIAQIFGSDAFTMAEAVKRLQDFDGVDINMGCPAPKIVKNGEGSFLLTDLSKASSIIRACQKESSVPVSVKIRLGFAFDNSLEIARMCEESGASFITVHGRTREQMYSGKVNLDAIAKIKANLKIPVVGNGDVGDRESYKQMLETGVDAVMIGRGACGRPWIFSELKEIPLSFSKGEIFLRHVELLKASGLSENYLCKYLRKHFLWYVKGTKISSQEKIELALTQSIEESCKIILNYL